MSERAEALARRFAAVNAAFIDFIAAIPEVRWGQTVGDGELRSVGMVAQHVAFSYTWLPQRYGPIAAGQPLPPLSTDEANAVNATVAEEAAAMTQAAVVEVLRTAGATATAWIGGLGDAQLDRTGVYLAAYPAHTVEDWIKGGFLGHPPAHLQAIRKVLER